MRNVIRRCVYGCVCTDIDFIALSCFNILRQRQNSCYFADDIFRRIFLMKRIEFLFKVHCNLFPRGQLTISRHWFRLWLNQWRFILLTHICVTRPQPVEHALTLWNIMMHVSISGPGLDCFSRGLLGLRLLGQNSVKLETNQKRFCQVN